MTQLLASSSDMGVPAHTPEAVCPTFGQRVLVVEDSDSERVWLEEALRKSGFEVASAANGLEALSLMATFSAHLVVSDWRMPGIDGVELCRRLRRILLAAREDWAQQVFVFVPVSARTIYDWVCTACLGLPPHHTNTHT